MATVRPAARPPWPARILPPAGRRRVPDVIDWVIAAACAAGFTLPVLLGAGGPARVPGWAGTPAATAAFGVLAAAPLVIRRLRPAAAVLAASAVCVAATLAGARFTPFVSNAGPSLAVAVFTAADRCPRRVSLAVTAIAAVVTWAVLPVGLHLHPGLDQDAVQALLAALAWPAGDAVRARRRYRDGLAAQSRAAAAEQARRERADERLRLSRDVHDVVSHTLAAIAVRSGTARVVFDDQPEQARAALADIEATSRAALAEVRGLLRQVRDPAAAAEASLPALADLPALVSRLRRDGLDVACETSGAPRAYPAAVEMSAYRIAQEALTNVVRHAPGARACLEIAHGDELVITVTDDGPGPLPRPAAPPGLGITGMTERAALLGGRLTAGTRPGGGFAVTARLPAAPDQAAIPDQAARP